MCSTNTGDLRGTIECPKMKGFAVVAIEKWDDGSPVDLGYKPFVDPLVTLIEYKTYKVFYKCTSSSYYAVQLTIIQVSHVVRDLSSKAVVTGNLSRTISVFFGGVEVCWVKD